MSFSEVFSLVFTLALCVGFFVGAVLLFQKFTAGVESVKANLREKGVDLSSSGMSVRTNGRLNQEEYLDATQRNIMKAVSSSSWGKPGATSSPSLERSGSARDGEESKRRRLFRRNKGTQ